MDAAGLLFGVMALAPKAMPLLARAHLIALALGVAGLLVLAGGLLYWHRRQLTRRRRPAGDEGVHGLKERLRQRLAEPAELLADGTTLGPTLGAGEVFEADLEAAAKTVLPEAGWRCGAARQLLRRRINGRVVSQASNGAEAAQWRQLGALALLDDPDDALLAYARAAELSADDPDLQMLLGVLNLRTGRPEAAEAAFRRQLDLANGKDSGEAIRYRAVAMLGDALLAKGARQDALAAYEAALKGVLALAEREPGNSRWQRDASFLHDRIGDIHLGEGMFEEALARFRKSLEIAEVLARGDAASPDLQHDLSVAHDRVGEALEAKGDLDGALTYYRYGLAVVETLRKMEPDRLDWHWDASVSLDRIGDALAARSRPEEALSSYRRALDIAKDVVARDPTRVDWQRDLAVSCHKVGLLEAQSGREAEAREVLEEGKAIVARLARIARFQAQWRADLSKFDSALRSLG